MARIIEITVSSKGETFVQTKGFTGADCLQASKWLEQALGVSVADAKTMEYFQSTATEQQIQA
jgi:hypothetical protein